MCGIVGFVGQDHAKEKIIDGLKRLEYRGYDSAGIALPIDGKIQIRKHVGEIKNLEKIIGEPEFDSSVGIGPVSYTHLDVYKRQPQAYGRACRRVQRSPCR